MNRNELKLILISSILLGISFPPFPLGFMVPVALYLFLDFLQNKSAVQCFRLGYWFGLIWGAIALFWIAASTLTGAVVAITINALHYAILWWLFGILKKTSKNFALLSLPFVWVSLEYLRLFTDLRFNWMTLAHTQSYYLPFIQIVDITGTLGISFVLVVMAVLIYFFMDLQKGMKFLPVFLFVLMICSLLYYGFNKTNSIEQKDFTLLKAAIVQPNVDPFKKWDVQFQEEAFNMLMSSSIQVLKKNPNIIVWPETATPFYLRARLTAQREIDNLLDTSNVYLLTGTPDYEFLKESEEYKTYNAAFFFRPKVDGFESYYKQALVPAAESMPFKETLSFLKKINVGGGDFYPGSIKTVFRFNIPKFKGRYKSGFYQMDEAKLDESTNIGLAVLICYESVFPHIVREFILKGANLLTIITNDGWFGVTNGPYQHAQYAIFRAIENRVSIIRCANTGISGFISPTGQYISQVPLLTKNETTEWLPVYSKTSFYSRYGDWFGKFTLIVSFIVFLIKFLVWIAKK